MNESRASRLLPVRTNLPLLFNEPARFVRQYWPPLVILLIGAVADAATTFVNLNAFGPEAEAHPVQRYVSETIGVTAGVPLAKLVQLLFVLLVAAWWRPWTAVILTLCGLLYFAAAVSNHLLLL